MKLSFGQWVKLGFGLVSWMITYREAVAALVSLWRSVAPHDADAPDPITHTEAIEKIRTGNLSAAEQMQSDRASQSNNGGA